MESSFQEKFGESEILVALIQKDLFTKGRFTVALNGTSFPVGKFVRYFPLEVKKQYLK